MTLIAPGFLRLFHQGSLLCDHPLSLLLIHRYLFIRVQRKMTCQSHLTHLLFVHEGLQERTARKIRKGTQHEVLRIVLLAAVQLPHFLKNMFSKVVWALLSTSSFFTLASPKAFLAFHSCI